jgi:hypothetical protein
MVSNEGFRVSLRLFYTPSVTPKGLRPELLRPSEISASNEGHKPSSIIFSEYHIINIYTAILQRMGYHEYRFPGCLTAFGLVGDSLFRVIGPRCRGAKCSLLLLELVQVT